MFVKEPVRGMRDILPAEMEIREAVLAQLETIYRSFGFMRIETPCMERIENLSNKQGGENEQLVFKVMKRGEKLQKALNSGDASLIADSGLRYDLTVPLSRYYAANADVLPKPFKAMQIGSSWRADRPQKGRFRQFTQCDIDILGDASANAEIELIFATSQFLASVGIERCTVMINDRRVLRALVDACGFPSESYGDVLITLDKFDKVGIEGVAAELQEAGYDQGAIDAYCALFSGFLAATDRMAYCQETLSEHLEEGVLENLANIIDGVSEISGGRFTPQLEIALVRGMGYYTGPIFEISSEDFPGSSIAGGGRYDKMVGQFIGGEVPACGFSIGFERIVSILLEQNSIASSVEKVAVLYDKRLTVPEVTQLQRKCQAMRNEGKIVLVQKMNRNTKHQREQMEAFGYTEFKQVYNVDEF